MTMFRRLSLCMVFVATLAAIPASAQSLSFTLPAGYLTTYGASGSNFPFNTAGASHKWQWVYDSGQFPAGIGPIQITEVSVRGLSGAAIPSAFNFPSVEVVLASSPNNYIVGTPPAGQDTIFANNLGPDQTIVRPASPWTAGPIPAATWVPFGVTTPFFFNPSAGLDLVVQITSCGTGTTWGVSIDGKTGTAALNGGNRYGDTASCTGTVRNFNNNEYVPIVKIDYVPAVANPLWQVNQPGSSFDIDGVANGSAYAPTSLTRCAGVPVTANFNSTAVGLGWDLALTFGVPNVPVGGGAFVSGGGQIVNLDLTSPTLLFLNGFGFAVPFAPFAVPFTVPVGISQVNAQQINIDPSNPEGASLSAATALIVSGGGTYPTSVPGPVGDDAGITVTTAAGPLCGCASIPFFGTAYTQINVITNGRAMFGAVLDTDFSPTAAEALGDDPFVGAWNDMNTAVGGSIAITAQSPNVVSVDFNGVGYFGTTGTANTFRFIFDCASGYVTIDNLPGITVHPTAALMFLGISRGITGATDPGATAFTFGGPNSMNSPTAMIYAFGAGGTLTPAGMTQLIFVPDASQTPNYAWIGF